MIKTCPLILEGVLRGPCSTWRLKYWVNLHVPYIICSKNAFLVKRQDVFGKVGAAASLVERISAVSEAAECYRAFDKGEVGKIVFDPWR